MNDFLLYGGAIVVAGLVGMYVERCMMQYRSNKSFRAGAKACMSTKIPASKRCPDQNENYV